jgi:hypothetical protein
MTATPTNNAVTTQDSGPLSVTRVTAPAIASRSIRSCTAVSRRMVWLGSTPVQRHANGDCHPADARGGMLDGIVELQV